MRLELADCVLIVFCIPLWLSLIWLAGLDQVSRFCCMHCFESNAMVTMTWRWWTVVPLHSDDPQDSWNTWISQIHAAYKGIRCFCSNHDAGKKKAVILGRFSGLVLEMQRCRYLSVQLELKFISTAFHNSPQNLNFIIVINFWTDGDGWNLKTVILHWQY
jgi:hypothetical protein